MQNMGRNYRPSTPNTSVHYRPSWVKQSGFGQNYIIMSYYYYPPKIPAGFSLYHVASQMMGRSVHYVSPSIVTCHDVIAFRMTSNHPLLNRSLQKKHLRALTKADRIIFISKCTKDDFLSVFDYKEENTNVIYHAASDVFQPRNKRSCRAELGLPLDRPMVLYVGSEAPRKNIKTLLRSIYKVKKQAPEILLVRIGQQRKMSRILVEKLGLEENILYLKNLSEETLAKSYNAADVYVSPSLYEGFGLPILEALKSGCPVIASNVSSLPEITGGAAILHPPLDVDAFAGSIETMLDSQSVRDDYAARGILRAEQFTWQIAAQKTLNIYRQILGT